MAMTDTRVIQMLFDNQQFEKNIAKSQKSIEELKEAMNFEETSNGLKKFASGLSVLNFDALQSNIQRLTDKFTGLGNAGEYVLSRIRHGLESAAASMEQFVKSISVGQIDVGLGKYDSLTKAVQTITATGKYTEEEAYTVMERVMAYTDQTSHSFGTMVGQIAALQSVGMELAPAERFLEGVANAATKAGAGASEAAASMSLISKVVGGTHLGRQQFDSLNQTYRVITSEWRQLAIEAGLATENLEKKGDKIFTAKKWGKQVEVTAEQLENTLNKKWFTSEVAKYLYGKYQFGESLEDLKHPEDAVDSFGKTAYLTGQRALTFTDALNAIKESVSSGWMDTFRIVLGDLTEAIEFFTNSCDRVIDSLEKIKNFRNGVLKYWNSDQNQGRSSLMDILLGDYWRETETGAIGFMDLLDGLGDLVFRGFQDFVLLFANPVDRMKSKTTPEYFQAWLGKQIADITKGVENFMQRINKFFNEEIEIGGKTTTRLELIYEIVQGIVGALHLGYQVLSGVIYFISLIIAQLGPGLDEILLLLADVGRAIFNTADQTQRSQQIRKFFEDLATKLEPVTSGINKVIESASKLIGTLTGVDEEGANGVSILEGIGKVITWLVDIFAGVAGPILNFISTLLELFNTLASKEFSYESIEEFGVGLGDAFKTMFKGWADNLPDSLSFLKDWIYSIFGIAKEGAEDAAKENGEGQGGGIFDIIFGFFSNGFTSFKDMLSKLTEGFSLKAAIDSGFGFGAAFNFLNTVADWFKGTNLYAVIMAFLGVASVGALFSLIMNARKAIRTIGGAFEDLGGNIKAGVLGQYEWNSEKVVNFGKGLLMIAGAIVALGSMKPEALIQGTIAVGLIFAAMMIFINVVSGSKFKGTYGQQFAATALIDALAIAVIGITLSLSILMLAILPLASDWRKMLAAILGFTAVIGVIGAFIVIMVTQLDHFMVGRFGGNSWAQIGKLAAILILIAGMVAVLSVSIGALMVAMAPLALMGWQSILTAVGGVALILTAMGTFIIVMLTAMDKFISTIGGGTTSWAGIGKAAAMMLLLSVSVAILSAGLGALMVAIAPLAAMSPKSIIAAVVALGVIMAELGIFIVVMLNQLNQFAFNAGGGQTGAAGLAKMAGIMLILSASIALLSVGIGMLILAITPLAAMSTEGVVKAVAGLGVILFELGLFIGYINKMNNGAGATVKLMSFAGFAFSMAILVMALTPLAAMSMEGYYRAIFGFGTVLLELIGAMWLMDQAKVSTANLVGFIGFAFSMAVLMYALQPLAGMSMEGYYRALFGFGTVLLELIAAMLIMDKIKVNTANLAGFIGFAASIAILIFALKPLAEMDQEGYYRAVFGLGTVMLEVVALMAIMKELKPDLKTSGSTLLLLLGLGASMILFGIAFNEVKDVPVENIIGFAAGIGALLLAIAGASILAKAGGIKGILIAVVGFAALMGVIALMAPLLIGSVAGALRNAAGDLAILADLLSTFSGKMDDVGEGGFDKAERIFGKMGTLLTKMAGLTFSTGSTVLFMNAMSRLTLSMDEITKFETRVNALTDDGGAGKATSIVTAFKTLLQTDLAGFDAYIETTNGFYSVLFNLGSAFDYFKSMTETLGDPEENSGFAMIKQLAACAPQLDTIYKMDLDKFQTQLAGLGGAMIVYAQGAASVNANGQEITSDTDIGGAVLLLQKISESLSQAGGFSIPENMPTDKALTDFGVQLAALAGALVAFEKAGQGLGDGTAQALKTLEFFRDLKAELELSNIGQDLSAAIQQFKDENGNFIQQDELTVFGEDISKLGSAMAHFASSTQVVDQETGQLVPIDYTKATDALTAIGTLASTLPNTGGWAELVAGKKKGLDDLATELNLLGDAMAEFNTSTTTFDEGQKKAVPMDFTNAIAFLNSVGDVQSKLPTVKSFSLQSLFEDKQMSLGELGSQIAQLGSGMNLFSSKVSGTDENGNKNFDPDTAMAAATVVEAMIPVMQKIAETLPKVGGIANFFSTAWNGRDATLKEVGDAIGQMGEGLGAFGTAVSGKFENAEDAINALSVIENVMGIISHLSKLEGMYVEYGSIYMWMQDLGYFLTGLTKEFKDGGTTSIPILDNIVTIMEYISNAVAASEGIDTASLGIFKSFTEALTNLSQTNFTAITKEFETVGTNITAGVKAGIEAGTSGVILSAVNMAIAAYEAAKEALGIKSPSKVFMQIGDFMGLGMSKGINISSEDVVNASEEMVDAIMDVVDKDTIGNWMQDIFSGSNADLLSRPIVDAKKLAQAGWEDAGEGIATVFTSTFTAGMKDADYEWNKNVVIDVTPITPDGTVLSPNELEDYVWDLLNRSSGIEDLIRNDRTENGGLGLLVDLNTEFENFDQGLAEAEHRMILLHQLQEGFYSEKTTGPMDKVASIMALVSQAMAESTDANPTITPVLDLSQVEAGLSQLGLSSYGGTIGLDLSRVAGNAGRIGTAGQTGAVPTETDLSGVYSRMDTLGTQIQSLGTAISNMKLILNTGVVAGGVTDGVDQNLGRRMFYAERGN